jgi:hypothetical protein
MIPEGIIIFSSSNFDIKYVNNEILNILGISKGSKVREIIDELR